MNNGTYIIMGAHGGIGEALAKRLIEVGHHVAVTARDTSKLDSMIADAAVSTHNVDVFEPESIIDAIGSIDEIAGLAYCIGSIDLKPLNSVKDEDILKTFELNALGAARALRAAEGGLKKAKGSAVLFSTIAVQHGFASHTIISMAKGAVEGLTRTLAAEWSPNVRVNAIAPSLTDTGIASKITSSEQMAQSIAKMHQFRV